MPSAWAWSSLQRWKRRSATRNSSSRSKSRRVGRGIITLPDRYATLYRGAKDIAHATRAARHRVLARRGQRRVVAAVARRQVAVHRLGRKYALVAAIIGRQ